MNITTELERQKRNKALLYAQNEAVQQVLQLEHGEAQEDLRIATALGDNSITRGLEQKGKMIELEKLEGKYAGNVFTRKQIKNLARKYNLRFLSSNNYSGGLPVETIAKLKAFSKETNTAISDENLRVNFFFLAPEKCFDLKIMKKQKTVRNIDPALFYRIDDNHFRLIDQWGKDFNIVNRIEGIRNASPKSRFRFHFGLALLMIASLFYLVLNKVWPEAGDGYWLLASFPVLISYLYFHWEAYHRDSRISHDYHPAKWTSGIRSEW